MRIIVSTIIALLVIVASAILLWLFVQPTELTVQTGSGLPISEPTGRTYNPQQTINGKTLQGSEL